MRKGGASLSSLRDGCTSHVRRVAALRRFCTTPMELPLSHRHQLTTSCRMINRRLKIVPKSSAPDVLKAQDRSRNSADNVGSAGTVLKRERSLIAPLSSVPTRPSSRVHRSQDSTTSLLLDSVVLCMSSCPPWNKSSHTPLRTKVFRLAAKGGASVTPQLCAAVNTIVIVSVPVLAPQIKLIKEAESRGVRVVGISWLQKCMDSGKILPATEAPAPSWDASASAP
eukprot:IDg11812t1